MQEKEYGLKFRDAIIGSVRSYADLAPSNSFYQMLCLFAVHIASLIQP